MDASLRPRFFISRQDGSLTPLIAVDELPPLMSVRGVPRLLSQNDTQGMTSLGSANHRGQFYVIDCFTQGSGNANVIIGDNKALPAGPKASIGITSSQNSTIRPHSYLVESRMRLVTERSLLRIIPTPGRKETPRRNTALSGFAMASVTINSKASCIFKHEMPRDPAVLEKLGLRDIPRWYREKHNIKSVTVGADNGRPRANRSNVQALFNGVKKEQCFERLAIEAPKNLHDLPREVVTTGEHRQENQIDRSLQRANKTHAVVNMPALPEETVKGSAAPPSGTLSDIFSPVNQFELHGQGGFSSYHIMDAAPTFKDNKTVGKIGNQFDHDNIYSGTPVAMGGLSESKNAQWLTGSYLQNGAVLNGVTGNGMSPHPTGAATPVSKPANKSPWTLRGGKADFSELPMSPFVPPKPLTDLIAEQEQSKTKHQKSRRLYQPRNDAKPSNGQDGFIAAKLPSSDEIVAKAFSPFGTASPSSLDGNRAPNIGANPGSYSSTSSSGCGSSIRSTSSSIGNGRTRASPENLYCERTASMTSRIFEFNADCDLFNLHLNDDAPTQRAAI
ncbi:hypothetical protein CPC735_056860 [Coccidioides posadasii C735 delta SOWgp]|uniref:Uncharacterized protein n=1 Tax=Coccidioides posadasii (strain C735) TaxID=222929 RepID=C5PIG3_COCP7|nr:hypothetical protein CPC735_056860 [Coccidioides posadasii C735 delta SOWgp]EER24316.1 hypothetical protein CPC735_056860 [Coccidioides posadasii C735 delta SOWgp]|eukprot:XP_003066461.1 hypothetical protein CPC735_056860 [Coccidioides posadasii C735 delta SOWgp]